jgi:hypothetical protein
MSGWKPMSVSIQNSQSASLSPRNCSTALFRAAGSPSVPQRIAIHPPRHTRCCWLRS